MSILYITQDGITDHIGRSQVAPYVLGLAKQGFRLHVLSAEKSGRDALVADYQRQFDAAGVRWTRVPYSNKPRVLGQAWTQWLMQRAAERIVRSDGVEVIHCRSFPPALIAHRMKASVPLKFLFDFRDFYADTGLRKSRGPSRMVFRRLKQMEGAMVRNADKIVCLTERARDLLANWYLQGIPEPRSRFCVIPCCADFDHFDPDKVDVEAIAAARRRATLPQDAFVLLYLGSLGPDYLLPQMLALFRQLLLERPDAHFLFVSNNGEDLVQKECQAQGIPAERIRFVSVDRSQVPAFIRLADLSVIFIHADVSKAGCSPTKLAELFACNVPVIANSGVGDLDAILDLGRNASSTVRDFADATLREAVRKVLSSREANPGRIRENSRDFTLDVGVDRYAQVYRELLTR